MTTFASITPTPPVDGAVYSSAKVLPSSEGDLFDQMGIATFDPAAVLYAQAIVAVVVLNVAGTPTTNTSYVVMQSSLDGTTWFDVAWAVWKGTTGTATFVLAGGTSGATAFQQSRASGTTPAGTEFNQCPFGGLVRFTGQSTFSGGTSPSVTAAIKFKALGLR